MAKYEDPSGWFRMAIPPGWNTGRHSDVAPYLYNPGTHLGLLRLKPMRFRPTNSQGIELEGILQQYLTANIGAGRVRLGQRLAIHYLGSETGVVTHNWVLAETPFVLLATYSIKTSVAETAEARREFETVVGMLASVRFRSLSGLHLGRDGPRAPVALRENP